MFFDRKSTGWFYSHIIKISLWNKMIILYFVRSNNSDYILKARKNRQNSPKNWITENPYVVNRMIYFGDKRDKNYKLYSIKQTSIRKKKHFNAKILFIKTNDFSFSFVGEQHFFPPFISSSLAKSLQNSAILSSFRRSQKITQIHYLNWNVIRQ